MKDPAAVYVELRSRRQEEIARLDRRHAKLGYARLATAACTALAAWGALSRGFSILWILVPLGAFIALMVAHDGSSARSASSIAAWRACAASGRAMEKPASAI